MTEQADIVVIGGGAMGSMITWRLSKRGFSVICIESDGIANSHSGVAGDSRLFRRSHRGSPELDYVLSTAAGQWEALNEESGEDVFINSGGLYVGGTDSSYLSELAECLQRNELQYDLLPAAEVRARYPQHQVGDHESAIFEPSAGFVRTERAVHAAFRLAQQAGARIISHSAVSSTREEGDSVIVEHAEGTITANTVIVAAGTRSPALLPEELRESLTPRRLILTWFPVKDPSQFHHSRFPIFVHLDEEVSMYGAPTLDGSLFKATIELDVRPAASHPVGLDSMLTPEEKAESERVALRYFNNIYPVVAREECLSELYTADHDAIVGRIPGRQRSYVATGFSGAGFKMSAGVGELLAQSIADGTPLPQLWEPARFARSTITT
jgi:sarcosine oxidase